MGAIYYELAFNKSNMAKFLHYGLVTGESVRKSLEIEISNRTNFTSYEIDAKYRVGFELAHNLMRLFWRVNVHLDEEIIFEELRNSELNIFLNGLSSFFLYKYNHYTAS